jgi:hypothetical protein
VAINFFPSGVTVGDTLLFLFVAIGYALFSFLFIAIGFNTSLLLPIAYESEFLKSQRSSGTSSPSSPNGEWLLSSLLFLTGPLVPISIYLICRGLEKYILEAEIKSYFVYFFMILFFVLAMFSYRFALKLGRSSAGQTERFKAIFEWKGWSDFGDIVINGLSVSIGWFTYFCVLALLSGKGIALLLFTLNPAVTHCPQA